MLARARDRGLAAGTGILKVRAPFADEAGLVSNVTKPRKARIIEGTGEYVL